MGGGESQLFAKSGMSNIGHFVAADAPKSENTYVYIVAHENQEKAKAIGKYIKELGLKGVQHQVQGEQLRVIGKKRDDLQTAIAKLKEHDFGIPLQFNNFRD